MSYTLSVSDSITSVNSFPVERYIAREEVQKWLEWAGMRLLALNLKSPYPVEIHVSWPEFAQDHHTAYGYTQERLRPAQLTGKEVSVMDDILQLPDYIEDTTIRRIVHARLLVTPVSQRYLYSWTKIAYMLHMDRKRVAVLHQRGVATICESTPPRKIHAIRQSLAQIASTS